VEGAEGVIASGSWVCGWLEALLGIS